MDFTTIGKIGSFVKQKNLLFAANYKIKTGQRIVDANGNLSFSKASMFDQINQAQKKSQSELDKARIASIKQKLMSGKKLSNTCAKKMKSSTKRQSTPMKRAKNSKRLSNPPKLSKRRGRQLLKQ